MSSSRVGSSTGGTLNESESSAPYWNAGPSITISLARYFVFGSYYVHPQVDDKRAYGFSLRSVTE